MQKRIYILTFSLLAGGLIAAASVKKSDAPSMYELKAPNKKAESQPAKKAAPAKKEAAPVKKEKAKPAAALTEGTVISIKDSKHLDDVMKKHDHVVIDFFATWCGPCKRMGPILDELAREFRDIAFVKVDVDQHKDIASKHKVQAMPTFAMMHKGKKVDDHVGGSSKSDFKQKVRSSFGK